ncbi:hypothetical protein [Acinetobacter sp. ANC 4633]|uniref:hypothetical protein n=1 Tax=Acinetobacter sp. ANC 4633 TaxID=2529845 RepID=UPI001BC87656|nr:hypothetical protein [Acinetobacter sp. ANC 4633]
MVFEVDTSPWTLPPITIPKAESQWLQTPTQVGDKGMTMPVDVYHGAVSGLGSATPNMMTPSNLSALVFVPISNTQQEKPDEGAVLMQGPNGVIAQTEDGSSKITVNKSSITMKFGTHTLELNESGIFIDGVEFETHKHQYTPGTGAPTNTGGPTS